jgi:hypothetical protein
MAAHDVVGFTRTLTPPLSFADTQAALQALTGFEVVPAGTT